jgi:putative nucleotidyltransferase with HDIG domain
VAIGSSVLLGSLAIADPQQFLLVNFAASTAAIFTLHDLQQRSQLFPTALIATLTALFTAMAYDLAQGMTLTDLNPQLYIYITISGVLLLFSYPLLYIVEKAFGFVSSVTLIELSNINTPLLRRMSREAAGTFNHSMQVANLAADAAAKIGAKVLLVRTGAFYHDIGKMLNPAFFTENQSGVNPHNQLSPEASARIIISHVTEGMKLADKYHLPKAVKDFIPARRRLRTCSPIQAPIPTPGSRPS